MSDRVQICEVCFAIDAVRSEPDCFGGASHSWLDAVVKDCPHLSRTPTGRVTAARRQRADRGCVAGDEWMHESHHYGDRERRHFLTLRDAVEWDNRMGRAARAAELRAELAELEATK